MADTLRFTPHSLRREQWLQSLLEGDTVDLRLTLGGVSRSGPRTVALVTSSRIYLADPDDLTRHHEIDRATGACCDLTPPDTGTIHQVWRVG